MINDGTKAYDHQNDGSTQIQGSCIRNFRNKPFPVRLKIEYVNQALSVSDSTNQNDLFVFFCTTNFFSV